MKLKSATCEVTQQSATVNDLNILQECLKQAELLRIPSEQLKDSFDAEEKFRNYAESVSVFRY